MILVNCYQADTYNDGEARSYKNRATTRLPTLLSTDAVRLTGLHRGDGNLGKVAPVLVRRSHCWNRRLIGRL